MGGIDHVVSESQALGSSGLGLVEKQVESSSMGCLLSVSTSLVYFSYFLKGLRGLGLLLLVVVLSGSWGVGVAPHQLCLYKEKFSFIVLSCIVCGWVTSSCGFLGVWFSCSLFVFRGWLWCGGCILLSGCGV